MLFVMALTSLDIEVTDDWNLALKLRQEDPIQFHTLVRMHLSFVLDLTTDDCECQTEKNKFLSLKWSLAPFSKKIKSSVKGIMEGAPLTNEAISQVYQLITFLSKEENIVQEGIFRRTGKLTRQQELKSLLNQGVTLKLEDGLYSVHDCASVLKCFLADLPEPLLTEAYFPAYCQISELPNSSNGNNERLEKALQLLLLLLPTENWIMMKNILQLLHVVASHKHSNKMSAENLATLFTPHLLCPRKLSPEAFHASSQMLSGVVAFMIAAGIGLFKVPETLATDIRAYWERRKVSPEAQLNESCAATTVFSFVDRERTAQENISNPTAAALAQLYAHIQSLPESSKKRRLVKQFNRENGHGTPRHSNRTRSLGESIKKHIFNKAKSTKSFVENGQLKQKRSCSEELLSSPDCKMKKPFTSKLIFGSCTDDKSQSPDNFPTSADRKNLSLPEEHKPILKNLSQNQDNIDSISPYSTKNPKLSPSGSPFSPISQNLITHSSKSCTGDISLFFTPPNPGNAMHRHHPEAMVTPRSRKPVVAVSGSNLCHITWGLDDVANFDEKKSGSSTHGTEEKEESDSLTSTFRDYLFSRSVLTASPVDLSFSSRTGDFDPSSCSDEKLPESPLSESLLYCLDGNVPLQEVDNKYHKSSESSTEYNSCLSVKSETAISSSDLDIENYTENVIETSL
uniref:Rho-GAP domain-containing protein n=1 Tax=Clastoptera arizonana TaxID=38151 RepID=A0A1B6DZ25_9HEMI